MKPPKHFRRNKDKKLKNEWFEFVKSYVNENGMLDDSFYHLDALEPNFREGFLKATMT